MRNVKALFIFARRVLDDVQILVLEYTELNEIHIPGQTKLVLCTVTLRGTSDQIVR